MPGLDLGRAQGVVDQGVDVDIGQGLRGDLAGVLADHGGEDGDLGLVLGPQGGDLRLALPIGQGLVVIDGLGAGAEALHPGLEGAGGALDSGLGRRLVLLGDGLRQRQNGQGGGEAEDADHGAASLRGARRGTP
jgi:hypothetical protein